MSEASCASASEKDASVALKTLRATRVLDLYICKQEVDPCLVCDGYTRLEYNTNTVRLGAVCSIGALARSAISPPSFVCVRETRQRCMCVFCCVSSPQGSMFSGGMHVWLRRNEAKPSDAFPILDLALVVGQGTPSRRWGLFLLSVSPIL